MQEYALYLFRTVAFTFYFSENNLPRKSRLPPPPPKSRRPPKSPLLPCGRFLRCGGTYVFSALALGVLVVFVGSSLLKVPKGGNSSVSSAQLFAIYSRPLSGALFLSRFFTRKYEFNRVFIRACGQFLDFFTFFCLASLFCLSLSISLSCSPSSLSFPLGPHSFVVFSEQHQTDNSTVTKGK